ncbi:Polyketide synthase/peptide synthetase [Salix suchowensis]|nr:Polyketide synthase/peptide synthetase [Salix suchowensis]
MGAVVVNEMVKLAEIRASVVRFMAKLLLETSLRFSWAELCASSSPSPLQQLAASHNYEHHEKRRVNKRTSYGGISIGKLDLSDVRVWQHDDEPGYPVDRRTWLKHNQREMRQSAVAQARSALQARDLSLASLSLNDQAETLLPTPLPSARQQVMDRKLSIIGAIQDRISDSHRELDRLSSKMSARPSATQIAQLLQRLKTLRAGALHRFQQEALDERLRGKVILHISTPVRRSIQIQSIAKLSTYRSSLHQNFSGLDPILQLWMFMAVVCNVSAGLSHRACRFLLQMTHYIVQTCLIALSEYEHLPAIFKNMLEKDWPKDIRSARSTFKVEARETIYAVCPSKTCHSTYGPEQSTEHADIYPELCTAVINKTTRRYVGRDFVGVPIKPYIVFDFKDWLASVLSRPGYEDMMDGAWDQMKIPTDGKMDNILQGEIPRTFLGPDGRHFSEGGRMGAIYFPCAVTGLTRSRTRWAANTFPHHARPDRTQICCQPIPEAACQDLPPFLGHGRSFLPDLQVPYGTVVMCAIICVICDLPGARKFGGFSACTHSFYCAICLCRLPGSIKHSIDTNVDQLECPSCECLKPEHAFGCWNVSAWERRQYYDTVARATAFNLAPDEASAQSSFDQSGLRYTELLELPYFDPTRFIVVDSMHNLFLGLLKEHFTNVLGYNSKMKDAEEICDVFPYPIQPSDSNPLPIKESEQSSVDKLLSVLRHPLGTHPREWWAHHYEKYHLAALKYVCKALDLKLDGPHTRKETRANFAAILLEWASICTRIL